MTRDLLPLNTLRAFEAAGRHQSFSHAAVELGVNHTAISRHVRGLENRLGVQLFKDLARGVVLSSDGDAYHARVTPALDLISDATDDLAKAPDGRVTVNCEPLFAQKFVVHGWHCFGPAIPRSNCGLKPSMNLRMLTDTRLILPPGLPIPVDWMSLLNY